ncbi:type II secretion system F family protein [Aeromicrobium duanguangcaii]|uniref:Type II secretion system F family protein n=1 Tax=Aeromicrobium duanguangcaii TaxID=2968086 RepID=A0ABY5KBY0_9ACTN|nr:type II secretion system F family protein [Aeromicrobium duanguangcaii]MCD9154623.1 type II secretion system F family protein [Aeromicrobium duanguangcaii]UUI67962.1 type II secretion system F family protein [Aeromicrobium duanguangcaii]
MIGAVIAAAFTTGLLLMAQGWHRARRPSLADRVLPYVRDVRPSAAEPRAGRVLDQVVGPSWRRLTRSIGESLGSNAAIARRLRRCGSEETVEDFRVRQATWGAIGLAAAVGVSMVAWSIAQPPAIALLLWCGAGLIGGCLACDQWLSARVRSHEARMRAEFPTVADLLALSVAAGESPVSSLERVTRVSHGALSRELGRVLAEVRAGGTIVGALDDLAARTGVMSVARFAEALAVAIDRGTPLIDVLHAQAADVREAARRELLESGGRREIAMMVPVVFLILPITIAFAFFPGLAGLHLSSGG